MIHAFACFHRFDLHFKWPSFDSQNAWYVFAVDFQAIPFGSNVRQCEVPASIYQ